MKTDLTLEEKIALAEEKVKKFHKPYEAAMNELKALLDLEADYRKDQMWEIFQHSERDYDQVITFLQTPIGQWDDDDWYP